MKISNNGINLLKHLEGCVKHGAMHVIYDDKTGFPVDINKPLPSGATIGYGHLITPGQDFANGIPESTATQLLLDDIAVSERAVAKSIIVPMSQNQYDALVIFAYNIGNANFAKSTVVKYINNPNFYSPHYPDLKSAWMAWDKSGGIRNKGLHNRRTQEWRLFNS